MTALRTGDIVAFEPMCYTGGGKAVHYYVEDPSNEDDLKLIEISDWSQDRVDYIPASVLTVVGHIDPFEIQDSGDGKLFSESARELLKKWI